MRASGTKCASVPLERELFLFGFESPTTDSSGQTLYETTSGGRKFSKCTDLKFSTKVQNAASSLLLLHTMLYLSRHQFNFAIKANILLFLLSQIATKGTYLIKYAFCFQLYHRYFSRTFLYSLFGGPFSYHCYLFTNTIFP